MSIVPMRRECSEKSEMVSQVLFGEIFQILELTDKWAYIQLLHDEYKGWIDRNIFKSVSEEYLKNYQEDSNFFTHEVFNIVVKEGEYGNKLLVPGSVLPFYEPQTRSFKIGEDNYTLTTNLKDREDTNLRNLIIENALKYYNAPYLWGGRSPYGIDCSGLTQMVYRLAGIYISRDASQQVKMGEDLSFVEEALPGDLAFFGDDMGVITHVGIIWQCNRIIHASGKVRIDNIDHQGIFSEEMKRYTHQLKIIKRLIKD
ncbi:MAG: C40 family peptidase [Odoribacter sp.]|nr:C40 family peptidase [Odoribacter sp.]